MNSIAGLSYNVNWNYHEIRPIESIAKYVDCIWVVNHTNASHLLTHHVVPDNSVELIFTESEFTRLNPDSQKSRVLKSHLSGLKTAHQIVQTSASPVVGVRFKPNGLYPFLKSDLGSTIDECISIESCFPSDIKLLEENVFETKSLQGRIELINAYFQQLLLKTNCKEDELFDLILQEINQNNGIISIANIARKFKTSVKSIERKFHVRLGIGPKKYARTLRLICALKKSTQRSENLTSIAYEFGFYDQAHFTKETRSMTGLSPKEFQNREHGIQATTFDPLAF